MCLYFFRSFTHWYLTLKFVSNSFWNQIHKSSHGALCSAVMRALYYARFYYTLLLVYYRLQYILSDWLALQPTYYKLHGGTYMVSASNFHSQNVAMKPRITPYPANFVVPENGSVFLFFLRNFCYVTRFLLLLCFLLSNCHTDLIKVKQNASYESIFG